VAIASRDPARARRLASVYGGTGVSLAEGADLVQRSAAVAVALSGPWQELASLADPLPPGRALPAPHGIFPRFVEAEPASA